MSNGLDGFHLTQLPESKKNIIAIKDIEKKKKITPSTGMGGNENLPI